MENSLCESGLSVNAARTVSPQLAVIEPLACLPISPVSSLI